MVPGRGTDRSDKPAHHRRIGWGDLSTGGQARQACSGHGDFTRRRRDQNCAAQDRVEGTAERCADIRQSGGGDPPLQFGMAPQCLHQAMRNLLCIVWAPMQI